jgi:copper homeostasis protein CutC
MPGGSVRARNATRIVTETGARDLHFRAAATQPNQLSPFRPGVRMASSKTPNEAVRERTSFDLVREMVDLVGAPRESAVS